MRSCSNHSQILAKIQVKIEKEEQGWLQACHLQLLEFLEDLKPSFMD